MAPGWDWRSSRNSRWPKLTRFFDELRRRRLAGGHFFYPGSFKLTHGSFGLTRGSSMHALLIAFAACALLCLGLCAWLCAWLWARLLLGSGSSAAAQK